MPADPDVPTQVAGSDGAEDISVVVLRRGADGRLCVESTEGPGAGLLTQLASHLFDRGTDPQLPALPEQGGGRIIKDSRDSDQVPLLIARGCVFGVDAGLFDRGFLDAVNAPGWPGQVP